MNREILSGSGREVGSRLALLAQECSGGCVCVHSITLKLRPSCLVITVRLLAGSGDSFNVSFRAALT